MKDPVEEYIDSLEDDRKVIVQALDKLIQSSGLKLERKMWGPKIIGYGQYHYRYASGTEGDWFIAGLASQKNYVSLYLCAANDEGYVAEQYKEQLGKVSVGKSCIRFKKLEDLNLEILPELLKLTKSLAQASE